MYLLYIKEENDVYKNDKRSTDGGKYGHGTDKHGNDVKEPDYVTIAKLKKVDDERKRKEKEDEDEKNDEINENIIKKFSMFE